MSNTAEYYHSYVSLLKYHSLFDSYNGNVQSFNKRYGLNLNKWFINYITDELVWGSTAEDYNSFARKSFLFLNLKAPKEHRVP